MNVRFLRPIFGAALAVAVFMTASARATTPAGRYSTTSMTVYDTKTKLTWQRTVSSTGYTWADANTYCGSTAVSTILGGTGRLPTIKELQSLVDYSLSTATVIDSTVFPSTPVASFWSSSLAAGSPAFAWHVNFQLGNAATGTTSALNDVRCVR